MALVLLLSAFSVVTGLALLRFGADSWADASQHHVYGVRSARRYRAMVSVLLIGGLALVGLGAVDLTAAALVLA